MMLDMQQKLHCCEKPQKKAINSAVGELQSDFAEPDFVGISKNTNPKRNTKIPLLEARGFFCSVLEKQMVRNSFSYLSDER